MKKIVFVIIVLLCTSMIILNRNEPDLDVKITAISTDRERDNKYSSLYSTDIDGDAELVDESEIEMRLALIYEYFYEHEFDLPKVTYTMSDRRKIIKSQNRVILDCEMTDQELLEIILINLYSEYSNYGLLYALKYDIAKETGIDFESINQYDHDFSIDNMNEMHLNYLNFSPDFSSEQEIEISKFIAVNTLNYIKNEYGGEYINQLLLSTLVPENQYMIQNAISEWSTSIGTCNLPESSLNYGVFNCRPDENTIEYKTENEIWILTLDTDGEDTSVNNNMYDNKTNFYEYINAFNDEIERLKSELECNDESLPTLTVEIYPEGFEEYSGQFLFSEKKILLKNVISFSHEYIHFLDYCLGVKLNNQPLEEMRAVYYSIDFPLEQKRFESILDEWKTRISEKFISIGIIDPIEEVEKYYGRALVYEDIYMIFADVMISSVEKSGEEMPNILEVDIEKRYPKFYWVSLLNYTVRNYGEDAVDTIMFDNKLPDGTDKDMNSVIAEWKEYISNFSEEDYVNYPDSQK